MGFPQKSSCEENPFSISSQTFYTKKIYHNNWGEHSIMKPIDVDELGESESSLNDNNNIDPSVF